MESQAYSVTFRKKEAVAKDTYSFYFSRPEGFTFFPGQYNRWTLPIPATDGRGSSRFFTISSSPLETDYLCFTTKIIQSDFKKALLTLHEHQAISLFGPMGNFVLEEKDPRERIFLAGGIGITPFRSMITYAAAKNLALPLRLFVSFSTPEEAVFLPELTTLTKTHPTISVLYTMTKPQESALAWSGETGRISSALLEKYAQDSAHALYYVSGPPAMVEGMESLLSQMHIKTEHIRTEQFSGY